MAVFFDKETAVYISSLVLMGKKESGEIKKPKSAYLIFSQEVRQKVLDENPGIKFGEVGKKIGGMWKALTEEEKAPYNEQAKAEKEKYQLEKPADSPKSKKSKKTKKAKKSKSKDSESDEQSESD